MLQETPVRILILMISMFMLGFASVFAFAKPPAVSVPFAQTSCTVLNYSTTTVPAAKAEVFCSNLKN